MKRALVIGLRILLVAVLGAGGLLLQACTGSPSPSQSPSPTETTVDLAPAAEPDPVAEKAAAEQRNSTAITAALSAQSAALLSGDKAKFLALADPSAKYVKPWLTERFTTLRAMGIAQWNTSITSMFSTNSWEWTAKIRLEYCFVANCAHPLLANLSTQWNMSIPDRPLLEQMYEYTSHRPVPWGQAVLRAKAGSRVVVAASAANASRIDGVLASAEAAARVADRYASSARPGRYVIYLATDQEWSDWSYTDEVTYAAGYALVDTESVILRASLLRSSTLDMTLRHEMTHVASLAGWSAGASKKNSWWLIEGLAEHAGLGDSYSAYPRRAQTGPFVRNRWNGDLRVGVPRTTASVVDANGRYGAAYLGVGCLLKTYGPAKTLTFFHAVAVRNTALTTAAPTSLGAPWTTVSKTCAAYIRKTAG